MSLVTRTERSSQWDTDGEELDLPTELIVEVDDEAYAADENEAVGDAISNHTGFAHLGCDYELCSQEEG